MFHIKICGVRLKQDIDASADSGADAIGLNFFKPSVRYVAPADPNTLELAQHAAKRKLIRVGVFVNEHVDSTIETAKKLGLDQIQLHGDESIEDAIRITRTGTALLRAIKLPTGRLTPSEIESHIAPWREADASFLLDADAGAAHGGSGKTLDWKAIRQWSAQHPESNWVLAGGLNPENIDEAIRTSGAARVDVASGVESSRGNKSIDRIHAFSSNAQQAFDAEGH